MENFANGIKHYNTVFCSIGNPFTKEVCGYPSDEVDDSLPLCSRHRKLINEPLREQIAREIEARVIGSVDTKGGFGEAFNQGIVTAAAIARRYGVSGDNACPCFGCQCEPNQVTKDAIEEARNQNDPR